VCLFYKAQHTFFDHYFNLEYYALIMHHRIEFSLSLKKNNCDAYYKQALGCCSTVQCTKTSQHPGISQTNMEDKNTEKLEFC